MAKNFNLQFKCKILKEEKELGKTDLIFKYLKECMAEATGTGMLVFWGCSACGPGYDGGLTIGILMFGLVVAMCIQIFGPMTMCHINPAVTIAFWIFGYVSLVKVLVYTIVQCIGATIGYLLLMAIHKHERLVLGGWGNPFEHDNAFCCTKLMPHVGIGRGLAWEVLLTAALIFLVSSVVDPRNAENMDSIAIKFAMTIFVVVYVGVPYTLASLNPARSFGPAVCCNYWDDHWIFWVGPIVGALLAASFYHIFFLPRTEKEPTEDD